jgi:hypothetical protein
MENRKFIEIIRSGGTGRSHLNDSLFPVPVPITVKSVGVSRKHNPLLASSAIEPGVQPLEATPCCGTGSMYCRTLYYYFLSKLSTCTKYSSLLPSSPPHHHHGQPSGYGYGAFQNHLAQGFIQYKFPD